MATDIVSVGIDIGTSTTQVIFSRIFMENISSYFAVPHIKIVDKQVIYRSKIHLTPLIGQSLIDGEGVKKIVSAEFISAGFAPSDIKTGAVIITGESARKENAAIVLEKLSDFAGDFVVSTAGPDLESIIAGKGSGAQKYSSDNSCTAINFDIGGGTTNVAVFDCGEVIAKGCVDIGGRQVKLDKDFTVTYISPSAAKIAKKLGIDIKQGKIASKHDIQSICREMSSLLEEFCLGVGQSELFKEITTSGSTEFSLKKPVRAVCFSGGVADCIYKSVNDPLEFGDIGVFLGAAIREGRLFSHYSIIDAAETIRATVVGAGTYTTSISGSTISYTKDIFPIKNVPVLRLDLTQQQRCINGDTEFLINKINWFKTQNDTERFAIAMKGEVNPSYEKIVSLAKTLAYSLTQTLDMSQTIMIIIENDMAKALGTSMKKFIGDSRKMLCIDSISAGDSDFIDFGEPLMDGMVIPVIVKTLIFS